MRDYLLGPSILPVDLRTPNPYLLSEIDAVASRRRSRARLFLNEDSDYTSKPVSMIQKDASPI